jgi:hypothetical protein
LEVAEKNKVETVSRAYGCLDAWFWWDVSGFGPPVMICSSARTILEKVISQTLGFPR